MEIGRRTKLFMLSILLILTLLGAFTACKNTTEEDSVDGVEEAQNNNEGTENGDIKVSHTEHTYGDWTTTVAATCTTAGKRERMCSVCEEKQEETISALGHSPKVAVKENVVAATCEESGSYDSVIYCERCDAELSRETIVVDALGHDLVHHDGQEATCTEIGWEEYDTCSRCDYTTYEEISALGHSPQTAVKENIVAATCETAGSYDSVVYCERCNEVLSRETIIVDALGHVDENSDGTCDRCGTSLGTGTTYTRINADGTENVNGEYLYFGSYPQTQVTNSTTKSALSSMAGTLPTSSNSQKWTSYGYYINGSVSNFMWYIDLSYNGEKYRGVYFTSYRPCYTTNSSSTSNSNQDDNGYNTSTVYWFKYEPIKWRILSEANGEALILCEMIIDSQEYYPSSSTSTFSHNGGTGYANNYALSNIRKWLNDTFYNTAFNDMQKALVQVTTVDNSARSTNPNNNTTAFNSGNNTYACANTKDKVFLLSEKEVTNSAYGFNSDYSNYDTARRKKNTDYAKCQGAWTSTDSSYLGNGFWWLRSPGYSNSNYAWYVDPNGYAGNYDSVYDSDYGVVPALKIKL